MRKELDDLLGDPLSNIMNDLIDNRPYLFEEKLNRISIFHTRSYSYLKQGNGSQM